MDGMPRAKFDVMGALEFSDGAWVRDIPSALKKSDIENEANYSKTKTVAEIEAALNEGNSVVASVKDGQQASHAVVVDRIENGNVVIRDPLPEGKGSVYSIPAGEFETANTGSVVISKNE